MHSTLHIPGGGQRLSRALQPFAFACLAAIILPMGVDMSISAASPFDSLVTPFVSRSSGFIALNFLVNVSRSFGSDLRIVPARLVSALGGTIEAATQCKTCVQMNHHGCEMIHHNGLALAGAALLITLASQFMQAPAASSQWQAATICAYASDSPTVSVSFDLKTPMSILNRDLLAPVRTFTSNCVILKPQATLVTVTEPSSSGSSENLS